MSNFDIMQRITAIESRLQELKATDTPRGVRARAYNSAALTIATATLTALTLNSERYDTDAIHSTSSNTSRFTIPFDGYYRITGIVSWAANATGSRQTRIMLNGVGGTTIGIVLEQASPAGVVLIQQVTADYLLTAGDYVELVVFQNSGGNLNVDTAANYSPEFWIDRLI